MPIYEYRCNSCGHQQEFLQRMSDAPLKKCPECGKRTFNKMLNAAGFQLKGTGWYATDFKNNNSKPAAKTGKADKPAEGAAKDTSKPAPAAAPEPARPATEAKS
jgi:putative FmdB family regulatory protein